MNQEFQRNVQVVEDFQEKKNLPMLTRRQIAFLIFAHFKINDFQGRSLGMDDLLNTVLINDHLKKSDHAWAETLMALDNELEDRLPWRFHVPIRCTERAEERLTWKSVVTDVLDD